MVKIYQPEGNGAANSNCTPATEINKPAPVTRTDTTNISWASAGGDSDVIECSWTTPSTEPNNADWPLGDYKGSVEIASIGADQTFKIQLLRVNSACAVQETLGTSASFSGIGAKLFTINMNPAAGAASDRFQMRILGSRAASHGTQTATITINDPDTFMEGPWVAGQDHLITDIGSGADTIFKVRNVAPITEAGSGSDVIMVAKEKLATDTGLGSDLIQRDKQFLITDVGVGVDVITRPQRTMLISDTGTGTELITEEKPVSEVVPGKSTFRAGVFEEKIHGTISWFIILELKEPPPIKISGTFSFKLALDLSLKKSTEPSFTPIRISEKQHIDSNIRVKLKRKEHLIFDLGIILRQKKRLLFGIFKKISKSSRFLFSFGKEQIDSEEILALLLAIEE